MSLDIGIKTKREIYKIGGKKERNGNNNYRK